MVAEDHDMGPEGELKFREGAENAPDVVIPVLDHGAVAGVLGAGMMGFGDSLVARHGGYAGSFFTGVLATVVASPCTAPFMGSALGFALTQPAVVALLVFGALGTGMAVPFLLFGLVPALRRLLPRPGGWMERLKHVMAFPLYASAASLNFSSAA